MRLATAQEAKKDDEKRLLERVAFARRTPLVDEPGRDPKAFPDGHFCEADGSETGVEVVDAFELERGEAVRRGSRSLVARTKAREMARNIEDPERGVFAAFGAHGREPWAIPLDGNHLIPERPQPVHPESWIIAAIEEKLRHYGRSGVSTRDVVLAIQFHWPLDLEPFQLDRIARWLSDCGAPFREVWIANDYGTPPQRVP